MKFIVVDLISPEKSYALEDYKSARLLLLGWQWHRSGVFGGVEASVLLIKGNGVLTVTPQSPYPDVLTEIDVFICKDKLLGGRLCE